MRRVGGALSGWTLGLLLCGAACAPAVASEGKVAPLRDAFLFAFPVYEMARTREAAVARTGNLNTLRHRTTLSDASHRNVTTPNNDTLYSSSWLDLSAGPFALTFRAYLPGRAFIDGGFEMPAVESCRGP
jgi:hypothetical protein